ncbi:single-stranded DNA-binding protein [Gracilimonas sp. Q87]|uniref:single-stranded DNA-binding protein n=1 Tax=Gracilimonas sp. Q87 TaxID=3384766 RepID=UPI0039841F3E
MHINDLEGIEDVRKSGLQMYMFRGTLGKDPEEIETRGKTMVKIAVGVDHNVPVKDDNGDIIDWEHEGTSWFNMIAFGDMAEELLYFEKGESIQVTDGLVKQRKWEDDDGDVHYDFNFIINDFEEYVPQNKD